MLGLVVYIGCIFIGECSKRAIKVDKIQSLLSWEEGFCYYSCSRCRCCCCCCVFSHVLLSSLVFVNDNFRSLLFVHRFYSRGFDYMFSCLFVFMPSLYLIFFKDFLRKLSKKEKKTKKQNKKKE